MEENVQTLNFYRNMAIVSNAVSLIILVFYNSTISIVSITVIRFLLGSNIYFLQLLYLFSCAVYIGAYQFMVFMSKPKHTETGQLIDTGVDLNMEGGIAEYVSTHY